ncbi:hypothetical protein L596_029843 [Steinernema carpocapsae]|uniref:Clathrin light chain n=1 Tax=Steinernema carpocapsae TaxID=34508 RepID=A0A4U5LQY5_STECR|nr:hypothetical protein L596_029843 [Steinernema carpocapsae]
MADPVADFLAREQNALADLEDESPPTSGADSIADAPQQAGPGAEFADFNALATGGDSGVDLSALDQNAAPIVNGNRASPSPAGLSASFGGMPVSNGGSSASLQTYSSEPRKEAESITKWRAEQAELLAKKDADEEKKIVEWREAAKKELEDWHKNREEALTKKKAANRERQEKHLNGEPGNGAEGTDWSEDTSRLRASYQKMAEDDKQE